MFRRLRETFVKTMTPAIRAMEAPGNPRLASAREQHAQQVRVEVEPLESGWEQLGSRTDIRADQERERMRPLLARAYEKRDALARRVAVEEEVEQIIQALWPQYLRQREELETVYQTMMSDLGAPSSSAFLALYELNWNVEALRAPLYAATGLPELRAEFDAVAAIERHWREVQEKRTRLFTHALAPGARPRLTVSSSPWADSIGRLSRLRANTKQENANATV